MEFLDEDARPRFLFQSPRHQNPPPVSSPQGLNRLSKPFLFITTSTSALLVSLSLLYIHSEPFKSLLLWVALSLLVGPFAPPSLTGGDIRVGQGPIVEFPDQETEPEPEARKKPAQKRPKPAMVDDAIVKSVPANEIVNRPVKNEEKIPAQANSNAGTKEEEEKEWTEDDTEILRKQLMKHPAGKPRRWEIIAEAFNGRHRVDSVIKKAKELADRKMSDKDSYAQFLKNRKPLDRRIDDNSNDGAAENGQVKQDSEWSSSEDIALLSALKAFPKDVSMRWEKIAAAVPGKTKAACMNRVAELKRDFRSSKAAKE
ncbi:transcription factor MAMYB isoform X2 [Punica granatum]|uniref:Transcription factor MAMYB isoform X2 n=1 Tax=Punica granatum TaxID=22663 RepID=A0A6P8D2P3_PUNGR|nr:transcription factor MAMYB isoform X2 [Punica granatum]